VSPQYAPNSTKTFRSFRFSRLYVERDARAYPLAEQVPAGLDGLPLVEIDHYKDVFNRPGQDFQVQKRAPALILAVERGNYLYRAGERVCGCDAPLPVYYNDMVRNCLYNCDYCFLQGMHDSAHCVLFVNTEDFVAAARRTADRGEITLSVSYLTDLLAFEPLFGLCGVWIDAAESHPSLRIEIRTKSNNYRAIRSRAPAPSTLLSFSISPEPARKRYEPGCAGLRNRLFAAREAQRDGMRVGLCFDPILPVSDWRAAYDECIAETFRTLDPERIEEATLGVFRAAPDFLKRMRRSRSDTDVLHAPYVVQHEPEGGAVATHPPELREALVEHVSARLSEHLPPDRIHPIHG